MLQLISGLLWISGLWIWWLVSYWFPTVENPLWLQNITWQEICAAVFAVLNHGLDLFSKDWDILHGRLCFGASSVLHQLMCLSDLNVMCVRGGKCLATSDVCLQLACCWLSMKSFQIPSHVVSCSARTLCVAGIVCSSSLTQLCCARVLCFSLHMVGGCLVWQCRSLCMKLGILLYV